METRRPTLADHLDGPEIRKALEALSAATQEHDRVRTALRAAREDLARAVAVRRIDPRAAAAAALGEGRSVERPKAAAPGTDAAVARATVEGLEERERAAADAAEKAKCAVRDAAMAAIRASYDDLAGAYVQAAHELADAWRQLAAAQELEEAVAETSYSVRAFYPAPPASWRALLVPGHDGIPALRKATTQTHRGRVVVLAEMMYEAREPRAALDALRSRLAEVLGHDLAAFALKRAEPPRAPRFRVPSPAEAARIPDAG